MDTIFTDGQLTKFIETMRQKNMTPERFNGLLGSGILADVLDPNACLDNRDAVRIALKLGAVMPENIPLSIDYSQSLEQMIAAGHYDWVNSDITPKRFKLEGKGVIEFETRVIHFNRSISSEDAIEAIKHINTENPLEPAKIEHLLAFGAKYPEEQRKYPIIGLGSVAEVDGDRYVPCLGQGGAGRGLSLYWWDGDWDGGCRFLAVRKLSSAA